MQIHIPLMGFDFLADVELEIHSIGEAPSGRYGPPEFYDPGSGPDFTIFDIFLKLDDGEDHPWHLATGELYKVLLRSRHIDEAILDAISNDGWDAA